MTRPEHCEQFVVRHDARIEVERERFRVIADVVVRRIRMRAAGIADARANDSAMTPEPGVGRPESTEREDRGLGDRLNDVEWFAIEHDRHTTTLPAGYGLHRRSMR
jgi:hypothetical protein